MDAPAVSRNWLRQTTGPAHWHLVPEGQRRGECGAELAGPVAVALIPLLFGLLPEPTCIRCTYWLMGDLASCEGRHPRL